MGTAQDVAVRLRAEMDAALVAEIGALRPTPGRRARRGHAGQVTVLMNGDYLYQFTLDEMWDLPDDMLVLVEMDARAPVAASVVAASGFALSLAVPSPEAPPPRPTEPSDEWDRGGGDRRNQDRRNQDRRNQGMPGRREAEAQLLPDPAHLLELLRQALRTADEGERRLASRLFGLLPIEQRPLGALVPTPEFEPAAAQRRALQLALDREALYVIGPPGTGKTATLAAMAYQFLRQGLSVLLAAHTNVAVDHALGELATLCEASPGSADLVRGRIVRVGVPRPEHAARTDLFLAEIVARLTGGTHAQLESLAAQREHLDQELAAIEQEQQRRVQAWQERRAQLEQERQAALAEAEAGDGRERAHREQVAERLQGIEVELATARQVLSVRTRERDEVREQVSHARQAHDAAREARGRLAGELEQAQRRSAIVRMARRVRLPEVQRRLAEAEEVLRRAGEDLTQAESALSRRERESTAAAQRTRALESRAEAAGRARPSAGAEARRREEARERAGSLAQQVSLGDAQAHQFTEANERRSEELSGQRDALVAQMRALRDGLADTERETLDRAQVVGTTLTRVYTDRRLRERRFDVVIVDEVSAAPLPTVYVAASRADQRVIVVGDPQQLPPIVKSKDERAVEWLGRDIFANRGITIEDASAGRKYSVLLDEQRRMQPAISALVRQHVYAGKLRDHPDVMQREIPAIGPLSSSPLVLCDTSDVAPVCLRAHRSRTNIYSAVCAFLVGCQAAMDLRTARAAETRDQLNPARERIPVGIVAPYVAQATLLQRLIRDAGLEGEMRAGTVHRFQGLECEALIFDAVESEPLPPTDLTRGGLNSQAMRLLNVAVTRARQKLVLVANASYLRQSLGESHSLRLAVEQAARAACLPSTQFIAAAGPLMAGARGALVGTELLDDAAFDDRLSRDLAAAQRSITIVSPFVTESRVKRLAEMLQSAVFRGVSVEAVTRPAGARADDIVHERGLAQLRSIGVRLRDVPGLHGKAVWLDDTIAYLGSLNVLSYGGATREIMLRVQSADLVRSLQEMVAGYEAARVGSVGSARSR